MNAISPRIRRFAFGVAAVGALAGAGIGTSSAIAAATSGPSTTHHSNVVAQKPAPGKMYPCKIDGVWWNCMDV